MKARIQGQRPIPRNPGQQDKSSLIRVRPSAPHVKDGFEPQTASFLQRMGALFRQNVVGNRVTNTLASNADQTGLAGLLATGAPIGIADLPRDLLSDLEFGLEGPLRGLIESPHAGMRHGVFDFAALHRASSKQLRALEHYLEPGFVRREASEKATLIESIGPLLLPGGKETLERFHLPIPFQADSARKPLTFAMEAEASVRGRPETLFYYAPDPSGQLDPRALTDEFVDMLAPRGANAMVWQRMSTDAKRDKLRWSQLTLGERCHYLALYKEHVDEKVPLKRISDPKLLPNGRSPLPETLCETLTWEGSPLRTAEIITETYSPSLDTLFADVDAVVGIANTQPGFHIHQVVELSSPKDVRKLGPHLTGLAALEDLRIFTHAMTWGSNLTTHTHLEVWSAEGINEVADSFLSGKVDPDALDVHKFHCVGMREGIYGGEGRVGLEIRAVPVSRNQKLAEVAQRTATILGEGHLRKLPAPPWPGWNAGKPGIEDDIYEKLRSSPSFAKAAEGAELSFSEVLEVSSGSNPERDAWKFASPFWSFESLPGVTPDEKQRIRTARTKFAKLMLELSANLTDATQAGREYDENMNKEFVTIGISQFYNETKIHEIIERTLNRAAEGKRP